MIEEEKARFRQMKIDAVARLQTSYDSLKVQYSDALSVDDRIVVYIDGVVLNPDAHNLYEILAVERFFYLLSKYSLDHKRARKFIKFYEALRFSGTNGRQRYKLTPVQTFQFVSIYGFVNEQGLRLCRKAYLFVPRKYSKTTSSASMAVYDMLLGDNNAQAYVGANSYDQAKVCFDEIRNIMLDIDPNGRHFRVNREKIIFLDKGKDSFAKCLTANAKTKDGLFASLVIMDEYSQARNTAGKNGADLKNTLTSSMGPRKEPLTVVITTASEVLDGPFVHELDGVKKVLLGEMQDDRLFASLFMPDVDDAEDDPRTWAKVQPHLGITVQADYYEEQYKDALLSAENMMTFRTKMLNIFAVNETKTWMPKSITEKLVGDFDIDKVTKPIPTAVAFDLSVHDDFSAVTYCAYLAEDKRFYAHTEYYFPEGALPNHPNRELYLSWHEQGYLKFCKGDRIDVRQVAEDIIRRSKRVRILRIGYDAYKSQELVNILSSVGGKGAMQPFSQTNGNFNLAVETLEMMAYSEKPLLTINDNPINLYCFANAVLDIDRLENKKPMKVSQFRKIDGVITLLMGIGLLNSYER